MFYFFLGFGIGVIGTLLRWNIWTTLGVSFVASLFFSVMESKASQETAWKNLRATTMRLSVGSGSIVQGKKTGNHYLLTNFHVCLFAEEDGKVQASYTDGRSVRGTISVIDPVADLCLISISPQPKALKLGQPFKKSEMLYSRGYPNGVLSETSGRSLRLEHWSYVFPIEALGACPKTYHEVFGHNGRLRGCEAEFDSIATEMYSAPGASGSPVVNENGDLVAVVSSHLHGETAAAPGAGIVPFMFVKRLLENN